MFYGTTFYEAVPFVGQHTVRLLEAQSSCTVHWSVPAAYDVTKRALAFCWECSGYDRYMSHIALTFKNRASYI